MSLSKRPAGRHLFQPVGAEQIGEVAARSIDRLEAEAEHAGHVDRVDPQPEPARVGGKRHAEGRGSRAIDHAHELRQALVREVIAEVGEIRERLGIDAQDVEALTRAKRSMAAL